MAFNEDINNTEGDATLQDFNKQCLLLTITYSASVDDLVAKQKEIMKIEAEDDAGPTWFTNDDFKDLLKKLKGTLDYEFYLVAKKEPNDFYLFCSDDTKCQPVVMLDIKPQTGNTSCYTKYIGLIKSKLEEHWCGSCLVKIGSSQNGQ